MVKITRVHNTRNILINPPSTYFGRSSYICYNKECVQNVIKRKKLPKSLKTEISQEIIEQIKNLTGIK
ncbi:MAG: hypothetical protein A2Y25_07210 [Candidatus Melainabacteria bacterium GWF2_37_15]|nr:MAG: hypothetical protein A2Y25_07210 [Candidatus Melainabacteria bacterium GWF2_37_15]